MTTRVLDDDDYRRALEFRSGLRRFLKWSDEQAARAEVTPAQHQLLLAIRGSNQRRGTTIGQLAEHLQSRHHSTVELVDRAELLGLVRRSVDGSDRRVVRVAVTRKGRAALRQITLANFEELDRLGPQLTRLLAEVYAE